MSEPTREEWKDWAEVWNAPIRKERADRRDNEMKHAYWNLIRNALNERRQQPFYGLSYQHSCPNCGHHMQPPSLLGGIFGF